MNINFNKVALTPFNKTIEKTQSMNFAPKFNAGLQQDTLSLSFGRYSASERDYIKTNCQKLTELPTNGDMIEWGKNDLFIKNLDKCLSKDKVKEIFSYRSTDGSMPVFNMNSEQLKSAARLLKRVDPSGELLVKNFGGHDYAGNNIFDASGLNYEEIKAIEYALKDHPRELFNLISEDGTVENICDNEQLQAKDDIREAEIGVSPTNWTGEKVLNHLFSILSNSDKIEDTEKYELLNKNRDLLNYITIDKLKKLEQKLEK